MGKRFWEDGLGHRPGDVRDAGRNTGRGTGRSGAADQGAGGGRHGDRGQTSIEYLGIIAVVVAIILVLTTTDFGTMIATAITNQISQITG
ncbi:Flp family type IVb pilin [Streptomyces syringium]|uniref:Flp family type IVb pilin n=1 Tax=Streptomyces syringium TaxID=76729 RepID=UPI0036510397